MFNIYIYKLRDGEKFLLCPHFITNSRDIVTVEISAAAFLYQEIVETNPIANFHHVEAGLLEWQVDGFVHTYMRRYGIENVRGGRYNRWILTDAQKEEISNAIKFFAYDIREHEIKKKKYFEYVKMNNDAVVLKNKIHSYELLSEKKKRFAIDRDIVFELNWLQRIIQTPVDKFLGVQIRYSALMLSLSKVFEQFEREIEDANNKIDNKNICRLVFSKPYTFFDSRVIPAERERANYKMEEDALLPDVIKAFELAIYTLMNREDEIAFEIDLVDIQELRDRLFLVRKVSNLY